MKLTFKSKILSMAAASVMAFAALPATKAVAGPDPFLGEVMLVGFTFCPRAWANADGQLLAISSNSALFSLYGTTYGGDGRTTFALPDLRGRAAVHLGTGPGLTPVSLGQRVGSEQFSLTNANQLPSHSHNVNATDAIGDKKGPGSDYLAKSSLPEDAIYHDGPPNKVMNGGMIAPTGASQPVTHRGPALVMRYCVALQGVYPSRN